MIFLRKFLNEIGDGDLAGFTIVSNEVYCSANTQNVNENKSYYER